MGNHRTATRNDGIHTPIAGTIASTAAWGSGTILELDGVGTRAVEAVDVGRVFLRTTDDTLWRLSSFSPVKWVPHENDFAPFYSDKPFWFLGPSANTALTTFGWAWTAGTTVAHPAITTTNQKTSRNRWTLTTAATAAATSVYRTTNAPVIAGLSAFHLKFNFATETVTADQRAFLGLNSATGALASTVSPLTDTTVAKVGIGHTTSTGNWFFVCNPTGTAPTTVDTGIPVSTTNFYSLDIYSDGTNYSLSLYNTATPSTASNTTFTTNKPAANTLMYQYMWHTNGTTASAAAMAYTTIMGRLTE